MNMGVPCQQFQLHMLTRLLKNSDDTISYQDFSRQVQSLRENTELYAQILEDFLKGRSAAETENTSCLDSRQKLLNPKNQSRFIRLSVRLIQLDRVAAHPGNFEVVLSSKSRVFSLISLIQDHVAIQTTRLEVFRSRVPTEQARLPLEKSLEECGYKGGLEKSPPEATVYYDYILLFTDCPILNCDHYFRSKPDSAASRARLCL
ncbi:uncharacterized protein LOC114440143 [Parambassis ranga]|uniref:Uncharacterized protein LOC114440143 n=1 Tax=Parambassis ranga TaxID=210632 RepID=A0A6P7ISC7_9TELE|nr:uncharacterized protein LOC114440143 [Parambassis ranga]